MSTTVHQRPPRILIIQHEAQAHADLAGRRLAAAGIAPQFAGWEGTATCAVPDAAADLDGLIVLGGHMNAYDDQSAPWLPAVCALLRDAVAREVPLLGLCLGAQLLARATGGTVITTDAPEVGVVEFAVDGAAVSGDPLFAPLTMGLDKDLSDGPAAARADDRVQAIEYHFDQVSRLPRGARPLAANAACHYQAFRLGPMAWGTQFHPEAGAQTLQDWLTDFPVAPEYGVDAVAEIKHAHDMSTQLEETWGRFFDTWIGLAQNHASRGARQSLAGGSTQSARMTTPGPASAGSKEAMHA